MGAIGVDKVKPGMVLEHQVLDSKGRLLLGRGTVLTEKHLGIIKSRGISEVDIEDLTKEDLLQQARAGIDPKHFERAEKRLDEHFRHTNRDQVAIEELYQICVLRQAKRYQKGLQERFPEDTKLVDPGEPKDGLEKVTPGSLIKDEDLSLPSLPAIYHQIKKVIEKPNSSASQISDVIGKDISLSAKLLRIVNSAMYGRSTKIDDLSRAVTIIGTEQICTLAIGVTIVNVFKKIPVDLVDMKSFWAHSVACGICARKIAEYKQIDNQERLFIAGLLHDIGRLIVYQLIPDHARIVLSKARSEKRLLYETEDEVLGFDHADIGGRALKKWKFPSVLENSVRYHHNPRDSEDLLETTIVHVADILINAVQIGSSGEKYVPPLAAGIWKAAELETAMIEPTIKKIEQQLTQIVKLLLSDK